VINTERLRTWPWKTLLGIATAALVLTALNTLYTLSLRHYCFEQGRYLPDEEYIDLALGEVRTYVQAKSTIIANMRDELKRNDSLCCQVGRTHDTLMSKEDAILNAGIVDVTIRFPLRSTETVVTPDLGVAAVKIRTCGRVFRAALQNTTKHTPIEIGKEK
jgi:hypothetical protein